MQGVSEQTEDRAVLDDEDRITGDGVTKDEASRLNFQVQLLGGFRTTTGDREVVLPASTWRLVAFLAIAGRPVERVRVANSLWMDKSEDRAHANLRSCLWRLRQANPDIVGSTSTHLRLSEQVTVDLRNLVDFARSLGDATVDIDLDGVPADLFCSELLPDWYDDFVEMEREQFRQLRLHALEELAQRLYQAQRIGRALDIALTAVAAAPLRESAHRLVISIHLDEGNISEALRQYKTLCHLLHAQLGIGPSPAVQRLIAPWVMDGPSPNPSDARWRAICGSDPEHSLIPRRAS
jgi:DNA-binding SARP family transcriptional activator